MAPEDNQDPHLLLASDSLICSWEVWRRVKISVPVCMKKSGKHCSVEEQATRWKVISIHWFQQRPIYTGTSGVGSLVDDRSWHLAPSTLMNKNRQQSDWNTEETDESVRGAFCWNCRVVLTQLNTFWRIHFVWVRLLILHRIVGRPEESNSRLATSPALTLCKLWSTSSSPLLKSLVSSLLQLICCALLTSKWLSSISGKDESLNVSKESHGSLDLISTVSVAALVCSLFSPT